MRSLTASRTRGFRALDLLTTLRAASALARERRALAALDDRQLADLGLTRAEAEAEARRPFWDAPAHWHR